MLNSVWDPAGVLMTAGIILFIWLKRHSFWRDYRFWLFAFGITFAMVWRTILHINNSRYFGVMILPALLLSFYFVWCFPGGKKLRALLFVIAFGVCFGMDFWLNPEEKNVIALYHAVKADAEKYPQSLALSFSKAGNKETFYTGLPIYASDRQINPEHLLLNLKNNFSIFDGDWDAVYFFLEVKKKQIDPEKILPKQFTLIGKSFMDRHRKKITYAYRYLPERTPKNLVEGDLLPNGDFAAVNSKVNSSVSRRAIKFQNASVDLPDKWRIYHSLLGKSYAFAQVVKTPAGNLLHMEADNYIAIFSPEFDLYSDRTINFHVEAETWAVLQISQAYSNANHQGVVEPVTIIGLTPGKSRRYSVVMPQHSSSSKSSVIFWLQCGKINLSDVRIK